MTELPFMMMNWDRFFMSARVQNLPGGEARGLYALLLGVMWRRGGWIKADDRIVAKALDIDVRRWRQTYKPMLEPLLRREIDPHIGEVYTQKTLTEVRASALETVAKYQSRTATARAAKAAKARRTPSVTEPKPAPVSEAVTAPKSEAGTGGKRQRQQDRALPIKKAESPILPTRQGELASSGAVAPLVAGSLPAPSEALLRSKIVKGNGHHGNATEPHAEPDRDNDHPEPLPQPQRAYDTEPPALGLFGALEAAIRAAKPDDDE